MLLFKKITTVKWFILSIKILYFYRTSEAIVSREKVSKLDKSSLKPSLYNKPIDNVVEITSTSSTMSESKSEISSNKNHSANGSCVDSSTNCSTDSTIEDDCNSVNDSNTLKSSKTLYYKINKNNDSKRYYLK